jgi:hypothetical protein
MYIRADITIRCGLCRFSRFQLRQMRPICDAPQFRPAGLPPGKMGSAASLPTLQLHATTCSAQPPSLPGPPKLRQPPARGFPRTPSSQLPAEPRRPFKQPSRSGLPLYLRNLRSSRSSITNQLPGHPPPPGSAGPPSFTPPSCHPAPPPPSSDR